MAQWVAVVGSKLEGEKISKKNFVPKELKSPKNNMVFSTLGVGWVGGLVDFSTLFC